MRNPWFIDELAHAGPEHLDRDFVAGFDRKQGHPDPSEDLDALAAHGVDAGATVVDLGAGTGQFALAAAGRFARVVAVDISPAMVSSLRERAEERGLSNVECVRAGFLSYDHTGPPADAVHTRHALHQLPDFWKTQALNRIAAALRPGGVLRVRDLIYDFRPDQAGEFFDTWLAGAVDDPAAGYTRDDYIEHIQTEHSTYRWLFEPMLAACGFEIVDVKYAGSIYGAYTCVKR
ncbi:class I SAM-dependent methyltransferase [Actinopolymorpha rutila]|uniref:Ubiquinone/menaquinone biosynthesis C-methylase UbiE n=1 Tax=Actinopolymorpha rutila TaxID=446787 RepID=A0A852ZGW4_9ACTN|nr:methyltransferase domain-containing protein [Actinopolymorpha rutila]NYH88270.1 ubiquinone/menaquinone biosynthesis C-methylase UbiE [Actinopolymorpha rutila]